MKSRNREINIFNMSLLDILCGALGAFCFMMIVLLPYYKPENPDDQKKQKDMDETMKQLEELKKQMQDSKLAKDMEDLIKKLQQQIKELEGRVNSLSQENKQLAEQNQKLQNENNQLQQKNKELANQVQQLEDKNQKLQKQNNQLSMRMPGVVAMTCHDPMPDGKLGILDVVIWSPNPNVGGKAQPVFNPSIVLNRKFFDGDEEVPLFSPVPTTLFLYRDLPFGIRQKIYVKLMPVETHGKDGMPTPLPLAAPMKVGGIISSGTPEVHIDLPELELTPQHPWVLVGTIEPDKKTSAVVFTAATTEEREEEWRQLDKPRTNTP